MKRLLSVLRVGKSVGSQDSSVQSQASPGPADPGGECTSGVRDDDVRPPQLGESSAVPVPLESTMRGPGGSSTGMTREAAGAEDGGKLEGGHGMDPEVGESGESVALQGSVEDAELAKVIQVLKGRGLVSTVEALESEVRGAGHSLGRGVASAEAAALLMRADSATSPSASASGCNDSPEGSLHNLLYRSDGGSSMSATPPSRHTHSPSIDLGEGVFLLPEVRGEGDAAEYDSDTGGGDGEGWGRAAEASESKEQRRSSNGGGAKGGEVPEGKKPARKQDRRMDDAAAAPALQRRKGRVGVDAYHKKPDPRVDEYSHGDEDAGFWREAVAPEYAAMIAAYYPEGGERNEAESGTEGESESGLSDEGDQSGKDKEEVGEGGGRARTGGADGRGVESPASLDDIDGLSLAGLSLGGAVDASVGGLGGLGYGFMEGAMDGGDEGDRDVAHADDAQESDGEGAEEEHEEELMYSDDEDEGMFDTLMIPVLHNPKRTGFEEHKDFPIYRGKMIAGRYRILGLLGSAAFSRAVHALDTRPDGYGEVCVKIIKNNKEFYDQSLDEIKLLKKLREADPEDRYSVLRMYDYFYHKEHLFLVCEILKNNLHDHQRLGEQEGEPKWFTLPRLQRICRQVLTALAFVHDLGIIHCDLKPENILIESFSQCLVKVIDFGSSCYTTDHLSSYVQSRSYRAPEVMLGHHYDQRVDIWSLGCILAEMDTGYVLFQNDSIAALFARIVGILGPIDATFLAEGRHTKRHFAEVKPGEFVVYDRDGQSGELDWLQPKRTSLRSRLHSGKDSVFVDFLSKLLTVDPRKRPTAKEALQHPWLKDGRYPQEPTWGTLGTCDI